MGVYAGISDADIKRVKKKPLFEIIISVPYKYNISEMSIRLQVMMLTNLTLAFHNLFAITPFINFSGGGRDVYNLRRM